MCSHDAATDVEPTSEGPTKITKRLFSVIQESCSLVTKKKKTKTHKKQNKNKNDTTKKPQKLIKTKHSCRYLLRASQQYSHLQHTTFLFF